MAAGRRGRPMKYTAQALRRGVEAYFASMSRREAVRLPGGQEARGDDGGVMERVVWYGVPTEAGLCLRLGIDLSTWENYRDAEKYPEHARVVEWAKLVILAYLTELSCTKDKQVQGVLFNLERNYGMRAERRVEVELGEKTRGAARVAGMSFDEKLELLRRAAAELGEDGEHEEAQAPGA